VLLECVREGIARAKTNREISQKTGRLKYAGRKPSIDVDQVKALHAAGIGPATIAKQLKVARSSPKF
jgi:Helix-turn-helix domain of resolvase